MLTVLVRAICGQEFGLDGIPWTAPAGGVTHEKRLGLDDVLLDLARDRDDLLDTADAVVTDAEVDDEIDDAATVGTTKRAEMFSPASSSSVHILTSASRALLACSDAMPGSPALSASSRSRHSSAKSMESQQRNQRPLGTH